MAPLRRFSGRADRERLDNLVYVRAVVESLPRELDGVADRVTALLPWGSLLAALVRPSPPVLRGVRALCRPGSGLTVVFGVDAARDRGEAARLGLPSLDEPHLRGALTDGYAASGFAVTSIRTLGPADLSLWPSTWARRLAFGLTRPVYRIDAEAVPGASGTPP